jgi:membrane protein DedA with SNARE-associated domain
VSFDPAAWPGGLAYLIVFAAAAIEGEIIFVAASALVGQDRLDAASVVIAGAFGAAAGDQLHFYLLRGRLHRWLARFPRITAGGRVLAERIRRYQIPVVFACRFAPGLRITIAAACAYAGVPAAVFSVINLLSAFVWASLILGLVAWVGPAWLSDIGISGWWTVVVPAAFILVAFRLASRAAKTEMAHLVPDAPDPPGDSRPAAHGSL